MYRQYSLEGPGGEELGRLVCGPVTLRARVPFELCLNGGGSLRWECVDLTEGGDERTCLIGCVELGWEFMLRIPYRAEAVIVELGHKENRMKLNKRKTMLGWGPGAFDLVTSDLTEHPWSISFDTSLASMAEAILRMVGLGLVAKKNDSWILGTRAANSLPLADQQRLAILNSTIRMFILPNDFSTT